MKLPIVKIPNKILTTKAAPVKKVTPELVALARNMLDTMEAADGVGLAAPQVGKSIQLFVARLEKPRKGREEEHVPETILFNPRITKRSKATTKATEGCLSIPGVTGVVERPAAVSVTGLNEHGKKVTIAAEGLYARVMQHEIDHLNGVLFTSRLQTSRVVFFGTSDFAVPPLRALIEHPQFDVVGVVTETDKPAGRGHALTASPVKRFGAEHKRNVLQPITLNIEHKDQTKAAVAVDFADKLSSLNPDFIIVASYGKILPQWVLDIPAYPAINIHPSLLPKYRGATPIQSAILHGETETGVAIISMTAEMDGGAIIDMRKYRISSNETAGELSARLAHAAAWQLIATLEDILAEKATYFEQDHTKSTYTGKITSESARIDWSKSATPVLNLIRAMSPKPGSWTEVDGQIVKILGAHVLDSSLVLDQIQLPGKKPISFADLKNGYPDVHSEILRLLTSMPQDSLAK